MKTTIELPDQLMTEVKVLAARERRKLGELMAELVRTGLEHHLTQPLATDHWLEEWFALADEVMNDAPPGPTARELLTEERNRLEQR
jgi:hypothetical protein